MADSKGNIAAAILWMFGISVLLFWLPVAGPFIAGIVGGKKAGGVGNAILAVFLPGLIMAALLFFFSAVLIGLPFVGAAFGIGGFALWAVHIGPLLLGAIIGGLIA